MSRENNTGMPGDLVGLEAHQNRRKMSRQMKQLDVPTKVRFYSNQPDETLVGLEAHKIIIR